MYPGRASGVCAMQVPLVCSLCESSPFILFHGRVVGTMHISPASRVCTVSVVFATNSIRIRLYEML